MTIKQLSIFVENKPGRLAEITEMLAREGVDIRAVCVSDTREFGILRLIVSDPEAGAEKLRDYHCTFSLTDVLVLRIDDQPGGLAAPMRILSDQGISVEYMYAFVSKGNTGAYIIFRVEEPEKATALLTGAGISLATQEEIKNL